ncbi:MAG: hypothetical protein JW839_22310 [Candidatus Lokiarchaeota archaeon]|nr:hypothetical protein [Candidatus Lokiarchaeota archaeon]
MKHRTTVQTLDEDCGDRQGEDKMDCGFRVVATAIDKTAKELADTRNELKNDIKDNEQRLVNRFDGVHEHMDRLEQTIVETLRSRDKKRFLKKEREIGAKQERRKQ